MDLHFAVSSGLKSIIGSDLILDDFIAVFELVKNSFDAHASKVKIIFENDKIIIWDNGKGMNIDDIRNKWLVVAYSAKKEGEEDNELNSADFKDYRTKIIPAKYFAGAKGIGRFSSDRIGKNLLLTTRKANKHSRYEQLLIDWGNFEIDPKKRFEKVDIDYVETPNIDAYPKFNYGTILEITGLRSIWNRKKIKDLKHSLEKLINPFEVIDQSRKTTVSTSRKFSIEIIAKEEQEKDNQEDNSREKINGSVSNFVFETLGLKTTQLFTEISSDGKFISTELIDRGKLIYRIKERNESFPLLSDIRMHLYYLNFAAKHNFKRLMGIESVKFGSVFLYKNGFRIYPFGEESIDSFGIDRRKQQGHSRYLGTRDLIGRIELFGDDERFQETSSRDGGLKQTDAYFELETAFLKKCFNRLEKYVVDIQWALKDQHLEDISAIQSSFTAKKKILSIIAKLADSDNAILEDYPKDFLNIIDDKIQENSDAPEALDALERIGIKTKDKNFVKQVKLARREYTELKKKKDDAEERAKEEENARIAIETKLELERQKSTYLLATRKTLSGDADGLVHNIVITTKAISANVNTLIERISNGTIKTPEILKRLSTIKYNTDKAFKISKLVTRANFKTESEKQVTDIAKYIEQYLLYYNDIYESEKIRFEFKNTNASLIKKVNILELSMVFDNLISNSDKAGAELIRVEVKKGTKGQLIIIFSDNGGGINSSLLKNVESIFDLGVTTTDGSGIGLYHVKEGLKKINGDIKFLGNNKYLKGAAFEIVIE